ncbi:MULTISPECIES: NUDIX hydrolase [Micrococcaceae]|jgi:8-oxo-dGTP pyrophosphatase MutT (NUDIX family)|uniref:Hydrolase, NUDIX family n=1 Tax=Paenarthrobacter aurescens (strain TC1) TaxID=290340 RepID=A1RAU9_PAEAT|nr:MULTISPECIES: NUDIX hydrolase [Micrococcaceae]ABM06634.1 putative hydrolase, NUDIX family [Paenarthrobacter aurescens TC1]AFR30688.1 putative hydrolase, NUDIX family [Arthrobacter sp. Rue61a]MBP2268778.1 8-oxo-dGTP pyrophosphatase MutT (NUDIX family) [Pseudarthrobacter sp. PvP004]
MTDISGSGLTDTNAVAEPRLAASVILLRDASDGLEAFVQHRVSTMDFAAGMVVFPGGRVDAADQSGWDYPAELLQRHAADWNQSSLSADPGAAAKNAGTVLAAAIREVQEEAGLTIDASDLRPWANWITPTDMPKRFDTFFYVAKPSPGATPQHQTTEAWQSLWMPVADILEAEAAGTLKLMPPTYYLLKEIAGLGTVDAVWSAEHPVVPVLAPVGSLAAFLKERESRR